MALRIDYANDCRDGVLVDQREGHMTQWYQGFLSLGVFGMLKKFSCMNNCRLETIFEWRKMSVNLVFSGEFEYSYYNRQRDVLSNKDICVRYLSRKTSHFMEDEISPRQIGRKKGVYMHFGAKYRVKNGDNGPTR